MHIKCLNAKLWKLVFFNWTIVKQRTKRMKSFVFSYSMDVMAFSLTKWISIKISLHHLQRGCNNKTIAILHIVYARISKLICQLFLGKYMLSTLWLMFAVYIKSLKWMFNCFFMIFFLLFLEPKLNILSSIIFIGF